MNDGSKLAETLAEAIVEHLNQQMKDSGKDNPVMEYLFGKNNELDFDKLVEMLRIMAMQVNTDQIKIGTLLEFADISMKIKYPEDRQFFRLIVQYLKRIEDQMRGNGGGNGGGVTNIFGEDNSAEPSDSQTKPTNAKNPLQKSLNRIEFDLKKVTSIVQKMQTDRHKIEKTIGESEDRQRKRSVKMERSIKHTIKSRMGKLWSMFKRVITIGLLLFFAPVLKRAFNKMADVLKSGYARVKDFLEPVLSPFVDWFKSEFPLLTEYLGRLADYVGGLAEDVKYIADGIRSVLDWKDEHPTLTAGITAAMAGAGVGMAFGPLGMLIGGIGGFLIGAGAQTITEAFREKKKDKNGNETTAEAEIVESVITYANNYMPEYRDALRQNEDVLREGLLNYVTIEGAQGHDVSKGKLSSMLETELKRLSAQPTALSPFVDAARAPKPNTGETTESDEMPEPGTGNTVQNDDWRGFGGNQTFTTFHTTTIFNSLSQPTEKNTE